MQTINGYAKVVRMNWKKNRMYKQTDGLNYSLIEAINEFSNLVKKSGNILFIVEGKKDKKALLNLGIKNILDISGRRLTDIVDCILSSNFRQIVVLTDFDREGKKKHKILVKLFEINGIKVNSQLRRKFISLFKIHKIEEINSLTAAL